MQIIRTNPFPSLPLTQEPPREPSLAETSALLVQPSGAESRRATRTVEDIRSAERLLNQQRAEDPYAAPSSQGREQRALAAYQAMQSSEEREYVSEVLGIDVYA